MSKFSAAGTVASPSGSQAGRGTRPDPIGIKATDATVTTNRRWIIAIVIGVVVVAVFAAVAFFYATGIDKPYQVREDSLKNVKESRNVEIFLQNDAIQDGGVICSGVFIRETGEILTAAHCFYTQNPDSCDFTTTPEPHYPSTISEMTIEVMNVNKTGAKYAFPGQIVAFSGITDVAIIKPLPLTRTDGSVISVVNQNHFNFAGGKDIERGDILNAFGYDNGFFKKAFRTGVVSHPNLDIGTLIATSTANIFLTATGREGASGSGWVDHEGNLVLAPLSFGWSWWSGYDTPYSLNPSGTAGSSGTSYVISKPLVNRMLNPNTPANGFNGQYLVPTLGIISGGPVDAYTLWYDFSTAYYPDTEMKGVTIAFLATSAYFNDTAGCGQDYIPTVPSLLDAPLDETINGDPPATFPEIPNGGDSNTLVVLEAIEGHLNKGDWIWMGSDAGLGTISAAILGNGHWVGDVIRVRIRAMNPFAPSDDTKNWEAIYDVTLQAVDPFWDIAYGIPFATYASLILVNDTTTPPTFVVPPGVTLPVPMRGSMPHRPGKPATPGRSIQAPPSARKPRRSTNVVHPAPGADLSDLPTVIQYHLNKVAKHNAAVRSEMEKGQKTRQEFLRDNAFRSRAPLHRHAGSARAVASHHHKAVPQYKASPQHKTPAVRRTGQHLKGRRQ